MRAAAKRDASVRYEKAEQSDGIRLLQFLGAKVYVLGTRRRRGDYQGTMQTPGIPDVHCFLPRRHGVAATPMLQWEVKRSRGGRTSPAQLAYEQSCHTAGIHYVRGDVAALTAWLLDHGYVRAGQLSDERVNASAMHGVKA